MNQFDQKIRDKINSKSYNYQPQAWKVFKQKSGMPMLSTGAKAGLFGGIAAAIVGSVLFFTLVTGPDQQTAEPVVLNNQRTDIQQDNTFNNTEYAELNDTVEQIAEAPHSYPTPPQSQPKAQHNNISAEAIAEEPTDNVTTVKPQPKPIYYGRPLEILVDTISSNDFPDYKAKPADMLP